MLPPVDQLQAIKDRGRRAQALLESQAFLEAVEEQTNYHLAALVAAPPGPLGADAVSYHHGQQHALTELVGTLRGHVAAAENMLDAEAFTDDL